MLKILIMKEKNLDGSPGNVLVGVEGELVKVTHEDPQLLFVVRTIELLSQLLHLDSGMNIMRTYALEMFQNCQNLKFLKK